MLLVRLKSPLCCAIALASFAPGVWAETLPASVRACIGVTDASRRLACFDKAVAPCAGPATPADTARADATAEAQAAAKPGFVPSASAAKGASPPEEGAAAKQSGAQTESRHLSARVASIERSRGDTFVHLDNGQVWQRVEEDSADLNLRVGDTVTIDKVLGAYWLAARSQENIKVKRWQ